MPPNKPIDGRMLRLYRQVNCLTQHELDDALGLTHGTVSRYETGRSVISFPLAIKIADVLDCSLDQLAGREPYVCKEEWIRKAAQSKRELPR